MDLVLITLIFAVIMMLFERIAPGRQWKHVDGWFPRAVLINMGQVVAAFIGARTWDIWFDRHDVFELSQLSAPIGGVLGYFIITFFYYWWHRARHSIPFLWKHLHQLHHSPARIEIITSFYKHPTEIMINGMLSSYILYVLLGLNIEAVVFAIGMTAIAELFYHWNINTPHWLGYFIQRPESHCVHHERNKHKDNYSDLPLWDMLFGTFNNPHNFDESCGFSDNKERQLFKMLRGINVNSGQKNDG